MGWVPSEVWAHSVIATDESTRASSSTAIAYASESPPPPPYSGGNGMPIRSSSPRRLTISYGKVLVRSRCSATGAISFSANWRTVSRSMRWWSAKSNSMT